MKAKRNKTIELTTEEKKLYLDRCLRIHGPASKEEIIDRTIPGDSFAVLPFLPEKSIDLLIVDPPYNLQKDYGGKVFKKTSAKEYEAFTRKWLDLVLPLLKEDASVYVCCDWASSMIIGPVLDKKLCVRSRITWQREKGRGAKTNWKNAMEDIWFATVSDDYTFHADAVMMRRRVIAPYREDGKPKDWEETKDGRFRNTYPSNFWDDITVPYWSMPENTHHTAQKPEKLLAKLILASSDEGDLILDPFLGSGSTSVTAKKLRRHYTGIEQNEEYCALAEKRLAMAEEDRSIQGYADGVFWERNTASEQRREKSRSGC